MYFFFYQPSKVFVIFRPVKLSCPLKKSNLNLQITMFFFLFQRYSRIDLQGTKVLNQRNVVLSSISFDFLFHENIGNFSPSVQAEFYKGLNNLVVEPEINYTIKLYNLDVKIFRKFIIEINELRKLQKIWVQECVIYMYVYLFYVSEQFITDISRNCVKFTSCPMHYEKTISCSNVLIMLEDNRVLTDSYIMLEHNFDW